MYIIAFHDMFSDSSSTSKHFIIGVRGNNKYSFHDDNISVVRGELVLSSKLNPVGANLPLILNWKGHSVHCYNLLNSRGIVGSYIALGDTRLGSLGQKRQLMVSSAVGEIFQTLSIEQIGVISKEHDDIR